MTTKKVTSKFDVFGFKNDRKECKPLTTQDIGSYEHFTYLKAISVCTNPSVRAWLPELNNIAFGQLNSKQKCMSITSFDGMSMWGPWNLPTKKCIVNNDKFIDKIMKVLDCSHSDATHMINSGVVNEVDINNAYMTLYEDPLKPKRVG